MIAHILSIGAELTEGRVVNTNATFLAREMQQLGLSVTRITTVGDNINDITTFLDEQKNTVIITTGGLGPTHDDITHEALYAFCQQKNCFFLQTNKIVAKNIAKKRK